MKFFYVFKYCYSLWQIKFNAHLLFYDESFDVACFNVLYMHIYVFFFFFLFFPSLCGSLFRQLKIPVPKLKTHILLLVGW